MSTTLKGIGRLNALAAILAVIGVSMLGYRVTAIAPTGPSTIAFVDLERLFNNLNARRRPSPSCRPPPSCSSSGARRCGTASPTCRRTWRSSSPAPTSTTRQLNDLSLKVLDFDAFMEFGRRKLDVDHANHRMRIYLKIKEEIARVALERGYHVVMVDDSRAPLVAGAEADVRRQIAARRLLFIDQQLDITDDMIAIMNNPPVWQERVP